MSTEPPLYRRHRFPGEIISHAVWLYHLFSLSLRDIEFILAERGVVVTPRKHPPLVREVRRRIRQEIAPTQTRAWRYVVFG